MRAATDGLPIRSAIQQTGSPRYKKDFRRSCERRQNRNKQTTNRKVNMKTKLMRRALATLVAAARVRWLQTQGKLRHRIQQVRERQNKPTTVLLANIAEG